jgi:hypothetical protein
VKPVTLESLNPVLFDRTCVPNVGLHDATVTMQWEDAWVCCCNLLVSQDFRNHFLSP